MTTPEEGSSTPNYDLVYKAVGHIVEVNESAKARADQESDAQLGLVWFTLDEDIIKTLYELWPQIDRIVTRSHAEDAQTTSETVLAKMSHSQNSFLGALLIAAKATNTEIQGYVCNTGITVSPDATPESLEVDFQAAWMGHQSADDL
jgi:hypothetical protein